MGWPANNGLWNWDHGKEILVGFTDGPWLDQGTHKIGQPQLTRLTRSTDGGHTWTQEYPQNFVAPDARTTPSPGNIHFGHSDFALRVAADGYHGTNDKNGHFFYSYDRGKTWHGAYRFNRLNEAPELQNMEITSRTSYLVTGDYSAQVFMTARNPQLRNASRLDKPFVAETTDGGSTFRFVSWVVPWTDTYRAVMPSTIKTASDKLIVAARRRNPLNDNQECWIDTFISHDHGLSWSFLSEVGKTGLFNGNPAGLATLRDGRIACCYGNRNHRQIRVRFSEDEGSTWTDEVVIRDKPMNLDIGYPQLMQNSKGEMVALYYITSPDLPHSYIESAVWRP